MVLLVVRRYGEGQQGLTAPLSEAPLGQERFFWRRSRGNQNLPRSRRKGLRKPLVCSRHVRPCAQRSVIAAVISAVFSAALKDLGASATFIFIS